MVSGFVAIHALNATSNSGRNLRSAMTIAPSLPAVNAVNQASNVEESKFRCSDASRFTLLDSVRAALARASVSCASVPHLADAYPDQAASIVTSDSSTASTIVMRRSCFVPPPCSSAWWRCSVISWPTSVAFSAPSPIVDPSQMPRPRRCAMAIRRSADTSRRATAAAR